MLHVLPVIKCPTCSARYSMREQVLHLVQAIRCSIFSALNAPGEQLLHLLHMLRVIRWSTCSEKAAALRSPRAAGVLDALCELLSFVYCFVVIHNTNTYSFLSFCVVDHNTKTYTKLTTTYTKRVTTQRKWRPYKDFISIVLSLALYKLFRCIYCTTHARTSAVLLFMPS